VQAALAEIGRHVTAADLWPHLGVPLEATLTAVAPDIDAVAVARRYRQLYACHGIPPITLLPGAAQAFEAVHRARGRVLVISAKAGAAVRGVLAHVGLDQPDVVLGDLRSFPGWLTGAFGRGAGLSA
jgi:phosphoglycolate phosphatase-like HAD superfamily hydrolase